MKNFITFLMIVTVTGALVFWREVWAVFAGMSVLEALNMIVQFLLHIAAVTVIGFLLTTLPAMIKPWIKVLRWKGATTLRSRDRRRARETNIPQRVSMPKVDKNAMIAALLQGNIQRQPKNATGPAQADEPNIHLNF